MTTIKENIDQIKELIAKYALKSGREKDSVRLLAVSKRQPVEKIKEAIHAGQMEFGENYLQEALTKMLALEKAGMKDVIWHFIGPIQRNKTRKIAEHFDWVHSIDGIDIAKRLDSQRPAFLSPLNICIQVNISEEDTKSGVSVLELPMLATTCLTLSRLRLRGLMAIPAKTTDTQKERDAFHQLFLLWQSLKDQGIALDTLSMGMSDDFEVAIQEGSTIVRIGTAIFGAREL